MNDYKELEVWQKSISLVEDIYLKIEKLPRDEKFALLDQIRRSAISIPSNIAEGHDRSSTKDFIRFLYISLGSAAELETQLIIVENIYNIKCDKSMNKLLSIRMMLNKLISSLKRRVSK